MHCDEPLKFDALVDLRRSSVAGTSPVLNDHGLWKREYLCLGLLCCTNGY